MPKNMRQMIHKLQNLYKAQIGFIILTIYDIGIITIPVCGIAAVEFFIAVVMTSSLMFSKLINFYVQQLNIELSVEKPQRLAIKCRLKNILLMHKEMNE